LGVEQLDGSLKNAEPRDGLSFRTELFARLLLQVEPVAVDSVEFGFEGGRVDHRRSGGGG